MDNSPRGHNESNMTERLSLCFPAYQCSWLSSHVYSPFRFVFAFLSENCLFASKIYLEGLLFALRKQRLREAKWFDQTHRTRGNLKQVLTSASPFKPFLFPQHFSRPRSIHFNPFCLTVLNLLIWDDYLRHSWRRWLVCFEVLANPVQNSDLVVPGIPPGSKIFLFLVELSQQSFKLCTIFTILLCVSSYTLVYYDQTRKGNQEKHLKTF